MSQHQSGHYPPPPQQQQQQQHLRQDYYDQYGQYQPAENGGYQPQYPQYPGQATYIQSQHGGPVQQPQGGYAYQPSYQEPHHASFPGSYGGQQPQQQQQQQQQHYNPQNYSHLPHSSPTQQQAYNPAAYAPYGQTAYPQQQQHYNSEYQSNAPLHSTSGPVDPYAYSPNSSNHSPSNYSQLQHGQPAYASHSQQYVPQPPAHQYSYREVSPPLPSQPNYAYQEPHASQTQATPYPVNARPSMVGSIHRSSAGRAEQTWTPSPPAYQSISASPQQLPPGPLSPPSSTPGPTPPAHGTTRSNTLDRHPHDRPLPPQPAGEDDLDYFADNSGSRIQSGYHRNDDSSLNQDQLFDEIENAFNDRTARSPSISISQAPSAPSVFASPRESRASRNGTVNGHLSPHLSQRAPNDPHCSSDSDVEAAHGLAMMRMAEEDDVRRQSSGNQQPFGGLGAQQTPTGASDSDDYGNVDMSSFGGGYDVPPMAYGSDPTQRPGTGERNDENASQPVSSQHNSMRRSQASRSSQMSQQSDEFRADSLHPFPPFNPAARVEVGGTGGLSEPGALVRRQSYDEGDEYSLMENQLPDRFPDEPPDIFFQQASSSYPAARPLPAVPSAEHRTPPSDVKALPPLPYPTAPDAYMVNAQGQYVPRSASLINHSSTPQVIQPLRSKTDAEERRKQQARLSNYASMEASTTNAGMLVDLPAIGKRFVPAKLGAPDFKKCSEPWSLKSLADWLLLVTNPEQNTELKEADVKEALVALFTNKVPTMNIADAEGLSNRVVTDMYGAGTLVPTEEWVRLTDDPISGVIFQLTRAGCYSPTVHDHVIPNMRCYSHLCQRTLKKVNLQAQPARAAEDWANFYNLKKEDVEAKDRKEVEKQNILHEVVTSEEKYMDDLEVLQTLFRDQLTKTEPSIITPKRKDKFLQDVFGRVDPIRLANEEHLLPQLKYRQQEQGPWIVGYSDIFRQWIRKARSAYVDYAYDFPRADFLVRHEMEQNLNFRNFVDSAQRDKRSKRLALDSFLKSPITRLQRYGLLLTSVLKTMKTDSQEKENLLIAIDEVKAVAQECNTRVAEQQRKIDMSDLGHRLILRPGMEKEVELNLEHFGRALIHRGELQRMGSNRFTWLDCHTLLFDHYMVIAKLVPQRTNEGGKRDMYDVSRLPIPMDLLILDSANDPPVQKSNYIKGIATVREAAGRTTSNDQTTLGRTASNQSPGPGGIQHVNTASSSNSLQPTNSVDQPKDSDRVLYPFRIKHLGRDTYTLFAFTDQARKDWTSKIIEAKTKHAAALHAQNAEPFRLRVMADSAFVCDAFSGTGKGVLIKGTPVDRALQDVEHRFKDMGRPAPICRARVNCATSFTAPYAGKQMVAVGTDYGVYVSELDSPRTWIKAINMSRVTQVAVLEDFNLFLLISDKALIAYHLDVICSSDGNGPTSASDSTRKAPQKLSGSKDVGFFVPGKMKDRTLVFYKKRENLNSVFKVLEPVYQKSSEKKRMGILKRGNTEFFREYDEFYIPTECSGMNLFHSSLSVSTARGFEVLTLDKKQPWTVPELREEHVQSIAQHIKDQKALSMLRLSEQEFLLVYANCAVYVNKHGDVSRSVVMEFVGSAQHAALSGPYLVLFDEDFVEIRNAQNGRLKQIIAGREIKCLDDGTSWGANTPLPPAAAAAAAAATTNGGITSPATHTATISSRTLKLVMQHPEQEKNQIVLELLLNENMKE